jgi:aspartyl protease family protein
LAEKALDDYVTAIELVGDKDRIFSTSYFNMARLYEKLGRFCDAVLPIEAWVSLNPKHDTSQTRTIIANYKRKGECATATSGKMEVFGVPRPNDIVILPVTINGTRGTFILDTGATFVSLKNSFAQKVGVEIDQESSVRLHTANGIVGGKRGRAKSIQLRSLLAKDVPVVVQAGDYGDGIDGLLGMSFLSRFNINIDAEKDSGVYADTEGGGDNGEGGTLRPSVTLWIDKAARMRLESELRDWRKCDAYYQCLTDRDAGKVKHCYANDKRWRGIGVGGL